MDHDIRQLSNKEDSSHVWEISYRYDYMSGCTPPTSKHTMQPNSVEPRSQVSVGPLLGKMTPGKLEANSILLHPIRAGFPWHTSISVLRQNKHWRSAVAVTKRLLSQISEDQAESTVLRRQKTSCADVARKELAKLNDGWIRFVAYLWPAANARRLELIGSTLVTIFVFDDIWEMNEGYQIKKLQDEFTSSSRGAHEAGIKPHDLNSIQRLTNEIIQGLEDEDVKGDSSGMELFESMVDFCNHPPPPAEFTSLREFLNYRIVDAAVPYLFAATKFSLGTSVDIASPRIAHYLDLCADHICYANDLGSFDKEKEAYVNGEALYLVNAVDAVQKAYNLPDSNTAKSATLALQLETEAEVAAELQRLRASTDVTKEEMELVEAILYVCAGNIFTSVVMSRYRGEASRIPPSI